MAKRHTSQTFTERAARIAQSPLMALALVGSSLAVTTVMTEDFARVPSAEAPASNATPQQLQTIHRRLASEGLGLHNTGTQLQRDTAAVERAIKSGQASEARQIELRVRYDGLHRQSQQKDIALAAYHARLLGSPYVSEQAAATLYSQNLKGTAFDNFYQLDMSYRDECRLSLNYGNVDISGDTAADITKRRELKSCMAESLDVAKDKNFYTTILSFLGGGTAYLGLGLMFGAAARRSRSKAIKKVSTDYAASLKKLEDLIKPKTP